MTIFELIKIRKLNNIKQKDIEKILMKKRGYYKGIITKFENKKLKIDINKLELIKEAYYKIFDYYNVVYTRESYINELFINKFESSSLDENILLIEELRKNSKHYEIILILNKYYEIMKNIEIIYNYSYSLYYLNKDYSKVLSILEKHKDLLLKDKKNKTNIKYLNLMFTIYEEDVKNYIKAEQIIDFAYKNIIFNKEEEIKLMINKSYLYYHSQKIELLKDQLFKIENNKNSDLFSNDIEFNRCISELYLDIDISKSIIYAEKGINLYNKESNTEIKSLFLKYLVILYKKTKNEDYLDIIENKIIFNKKLPKNTLQNIIFYLLQSGIKIKKLENMINKDI